MGTADAPSYAIPAGGEDRVPVFAGFGTIPVAVLNAAPEPFTQRVMELAIPGTERATATVATDMGVSGSALKRGRHPNGCRAPYMPEDPITVLAWYLTLGVGPGRVAWVLRIADMYKRFHIRFKT